MLTKVKSYLRKKESKTPQVLRQEALELLGLEEKDLKILRIIESGESGRIMAISKTLKISPVILNKLSSMGEDEIERLVHLTTASYPEKVKALLPKVDTYSTFSTQVFACYAAAKKKGNKFGNIWKYKYPVEHLKSAKEILDLIIKRGEVDIEEIYRIVIYMYYSAYVVLNGVKEKKKKVA